MGDTEIVDKFLFGRTAEDIRNIELIMALYPRPKNPTDAIRLALSARVANADPVELEQVKRAISKKAKATK